MALSDTCCARSVVGSRWAEKHVRHLWEKGVETFVIDEARPFRFGDNATTHSSYAIVFPIYVPGAEQRVFVRVSVVDDNVISVSAKVAQTTPRYLCSAN